MDMTLDELAAMMGREFSRIYARFDTVDERFEQIDVRFERMDERFDRMDGRFDRLEARTMRIEEAVDDHTAQLAGIDDRLSRIEFTLQDANPRDLKRRVERLEARPA